jgi:hypothetical protein
MRASVSDAVLSNLRKSYARGESLALTCQFGDLAMNLEPGKSGGRESARALL